MLRFNDGVEIDTSGEYRPLKLKDGWYVVGHGICVPVASRAEALAEIKVLTKTTRAKRQSVRQVVDLTKYSAVEIMELWDAAEQLAKNSGVVPTRRAWTKLATKQKKLWLARVVAERNATPQADEPNAWSDMCAAVASGENVTEKLAAIGRGERPKGADSDRRLAKAIDSHHSALDAAKKAVAAWAVKQNGRRDVVASAMLERLADCRKDRNGDETLEVVSELFEEHVELLESDGANAVAHALGQLGIAAQTLGRVHTMRVER